MRSLEREIPGQKSQEEVQAQVEIFSNKGVDDFSDDQGTLLKYSAELAKIQDLHNPPSDVPAELIELLKKYRVSYLEFLRKEQRIETTFVEENIRIYNKQYRPSVAELKKKLEKVSELDSLQLTEYLGSGSSGDVFRIEVAGKSFAVKFSRSKKGSIGATQANFQLKALLRAKGLPHTAQLEAYSFEDGVIITELLPGQDVTTFEPQHAPEYPDEHISQLIDTVIEMNNRGLVIDPRPSNFMYDPKVGFSVLDFRISQGDSDPTLSQQIMSLKGALTARRFKRINEEVPDHEEKSKAQEIEKYKISLSMTVRFLTIMKERHPDVLATWQEQQGGTEDQPVAAFGLIDRKKIPQHPNLEPYIQKLEEMGF